MAECSLEPQNKSAGAVQIEKHPDAQYNAHHCSTFTHEPAQIHTSDHLPFDNNLAGVALKQEASSNHEPEETSNTIAPDSTPERLRLELIERLVRQSMFEGFQGGDEQGAIEGLTAMKQGRIVDTKTGASWGVVRLFADPSTNTRRSGVVSNASTQQRHQVASSTRLPPKPPAHHAAQATHAIAQPACENCFTTHTPLWRKIGGLLLCNACGIYLKNNGVMRDLGLLGTRRWGNKKPAGGGGKGGNNGRGKKRAYSSSSRDEAEDEQLVKDDEDDGNVVVARSNGETLHDTHINSESQC